MSEQMIYRVDLGLLSFYFNTGIHWCGSVQRLPIFYGHLDHSTRQASTTTDTSGRHGGVVEADATVLG